MHVLQKNYFRLLGTNSLEGRTSRLVVNWFVMRGSAYGFGFKFYNLHANYRTSSGLIDWLPILFVAKICTKVALVPSAHPVIKGRYF